MDEITLTNGRTLRPQLHINGDGSATTATLLVDRIFFQDGPGWLREIWNKFATEPFHGGPGQWFSHGFRLEKIGRRYVLLEQSFALDI